MLLFVDNKETLTQKATVAAKKALPGIRVLRLSEPYDVKKIVEALRNALPEEHPAEPTANPVTRLDHHKVRNALSAMLAGVRALGADLRADAHDSQAIREHIDEYEPRLVSLIRDLTSLLDSTSRGAMGQHRTGEPT